MIDPRVVASLKERARNGETIVVECGDMSIKLVPCNRDGNTFLLLTRDGMKPILPAMCYAWGAALGVPSGTEWQTGLRDTAAWCEFACMFPTGGKMVQP